jgi:hypothetical protein
MKHGPARGNDSEADLRSEGGKGKHRYKKGGRVQVNVVNIHKHPPMTAAGPMAPTPPAASPGLPPGAAMVGPGAGLPPQAGMPGQPMPPGMPMRARGGHVHHGAYEDPPEDISDYKPAHARKNQGGGLTDSYGSATGMSRRAEYRKMKGR